MPSIVKKRKLRTGRGSMTGDKASIDDIYLVRMDSQIDKKTALELWAADGSLPQPQATFLTVAGRTTVCDTVDAEVANAQRYLWYFRVSWKDQTDSNPTPQTQPSPSGSDVLAWAPVVTRRPVTVQLPAESLFYEGGYSSVIHTDYSSNTSGGERSPFTNSARCPFRDQLPPHQRKQSLWTIRWQRPTIPAGLLAAELKLNDAAVTFAHRGYAEDWDEKTAKIESVSVSETKWNNTQLWEIVVEILHDADGHTIKALDQGMMENYSPGEMLGGTSVLVMTKQNIKDHEGKAVLEPVLLDGAGKKLTGSTEVYGEWRDFELTDFAGVPLLGDLFL